MTAQQVILVFPFIAQGIAMFFDEFYFHRRRGLPKWERIGHPIDTISVLICYLWVIFREPSIFNITVYIGLAAFSCLLVTKDEFVHKKYCSSTETWLHSVLFVLHPISFLVAGLLWIKPALLDPNTLQNASQIIIGQIILVVAFLIYQTTYWNFIWQPKQK